MKAKKLEQGMDNPNMDISYEGKKVSFRLTEKAGRIRGINVRIL